MEIKSKKIMGLILALVMLVGCLSLNPIATYAAEGDVELNEKNFPDNNFKWYLYYNFDIDKNMVLSQAECNDVKEISVDRYSISSLKGIEYFKNLKELDCKSNQLKSLDVRQNTNLQKLDCQVNNLESLDLSKNIALIKLNCVANNITSLDLSKHTLLTYLDCCCNQLTSLDVSGDTALENLVCYNNQLTSLDVGDNPALENLDCYNNKLKSLNVSGDKALKDLRCCNNQLTSLDVGDNPALENLDCYNNKLKSLNVSGDKALENLDCYNNKLKSLNVSGDKALKYLNCYNNQLTSLDVGDNPALKSLKCYNNQLTSLDVSGHTALEYLNCNNNQLTSLDVSGHTALEYLNCNNNQLTSLDTSKNTALKTLYCNNNQLRSLDTSKNTVLVTLDCNNNQITSLDVSDNQDLWNLVGYNNPMTYVKLPDRFFYKSLSPVTYTVRVTEGSSKIPFTALPKGFDSSRIQPDTLTGVKMEKDGFNWNMATNPIKFKYKLCGNPEEIVDAELRLLLEVVGPVDPTKPEGKNPDESKYWAVKFESEDESKGTVAAKNTFYVLKTERKTLADLASKAPEVTAKTGFKFTGWNPALYANTSINGNLTVNATFKKVTVTPAPTPTPSPNPSIEYKRDHTPSIPVIVNVAKTMKLSVKLIIGSKEMIKSVDGVEEKIIMDVAPFIENGRTMLPIRFVAEGLGFNVRWEKDSRTVILIDKENVVKIPVDTNKIIVNEKEYTSDVKPVIKNDRTMLPIANIARALGLKDGKDIHWNENTKEVIITREIVK
ncbi:leucine-rich repeat domain-containing protein [Peptoniphilus vaginalis]|uniref:leucine-rich repeat domain-containing protein n=1 Tax=Peptoniphilus vaginalis TaxID=1756987 RepID=UPI0023F901CA|nr:leucine-rich repeat domain-containing protein [Peptoniphilus vaginalis]